MGAGAIGTFYGARLALAGAEVHFFVRSGLAEMRARGLTLREGSAVQTLPAARTAVYNSTGEIGPVDVAIVTLKNTANDRLAELLPPLLGPATVILTLQNGLGADELLASLFGRQRVVGGLAFSQLMTLYLTPVVYTYMAAIVERWNAWRSPKALTPVMQAAD